MENTADKTIITVVERPELEKGDIPAMIIAAFITFIPVAILVLGIILVAGYFLLH